MDLLLIVRDALASSVAGSLLVALEASAAGQKVAVLFTQEALAALARGTLGWPRELDGQRMRLLLADRGKASGLPLGGRGEGRRLDAKALLERAREAGVALYACPLWASLLDLEGELPAVLERIDRPALLALLGRARSVIGSL